LITIEAKTTKKDGDHISVKVSSSEGLAFDRERKFSSTQGARKYCGKINRRQKLYGKRYYIAKAMENKRKQSTMKTLTNELKEKYNG
tara:strand:+ start:1016 stop:1276 length:261 start_codon:yes stop_codon:yes gene_type:complete